MERRTAAGVLIAGTLATLIATSIFWKLTDRRAEDTRRIESIADGLTKTLAGGASPQAVLSAVVDSGSVAGAVLYDANGSPVARAGTSKNATSEVVCRSVASGTLCVEPLPSRPPRLDAILAAAGGGIALTIIATFVITAMLRQKLRDVRRDVEHAVADPSFAQRIDPVNGELAPLVETINKVLDQIRNREAELRRRTHDLEFANKDLESFAHTISHDLRGPLGSVLGFAESLRDGEGSQLNDDGRESVRWILESANTMRDLIDGLLQMSRLSREEMERGNVDLSAIAKGIAYSLQKNKPERDVDFHIAENVVAHGDERLLRAVMENLLTNAWKFTGKREHARIEFGRLHENGHSTFYVRDNGAGFDPAHAAKMFRPFQRLHSSKEFEGTGIGLATVQRILQRHGGRVWAEGEPDRGATIYFMTETP